MSQLEKNLSPEKARKAAKEHKAKNRRVFIKTLFSRKLVLVSSIILVLIIMAAILAPVISPYNPNAIAV